MTSPSPTSSLFDGAVGAIQQLLNEIAARASFPIGPLPDTPQGDVLEPRGDAARAGADSVERLIDSITRRHDVDPQAARASRPLLMSTVVATGSGGGSIRLRVDASAPNADWAVAGRESAMVAVYVDGRYHSTILVHGERTSPYQVNLGALPPGRHQVELRAATDAAPIRAVVTGASASEATGEQALVDRHAPVLELRDTDRGARSSSARSDAPLLLMPAVTHNADGSTTIEYRVLFSNEDGGTSAPDLFARHGRGVDAEPILRVRVDGNGRVLEERYQASLHRWLSFDGERIGTRPVLRVSTANNLVSARRSTRPVERWSDAAVAPISAATSEFSVMLEHPWTWRMMAGELLREGKAVGGADAVRGARQVADPRRYVYLGSLTDAARAAIAAAGGLELVLHDGRHVFARVAKGFATGRFRQSALELPTGAVADAVRGVSSLDVDALVLDPSLAVRVLRRVA